MKVHKKELLPIYDLNIYSLCKYTYSNFSTIFSVNFHFFYSFIFKKKLSSSYSFFNINDGFFSMSDHEGHLLRSAFEQKHY